MNSRRTIAFFAFALFARGVPGCTPGPEAPPSAAPIAPAAIDPRPPAVASAARPHAPTDDATFRHRAVAVDDHMRVHTESVSRVVRPDGIPEGERYVSDYELIVRKTSGSAVTEAFVVFHTNARSAWDGVDDDFRAAAKPTALEGKRLRLHAEPLSVEEDTGGVVSAEVSQAALAAVSDLGMRGAMEAALPDKTLTIGDRVDALAPALVRAMNPRTWHLESGGATLRSLSESEGVFESTLTVLTESGRTLALAGTVKIDRRDRTILDIDLAGSFRETDQGVNAVNRAATGARGAGSPASGAGDGTHGELSYKRTVAPARTERKDAPAQNIPK